MYYDFSKADWKQDFEYAYSLVANSFNKFTEQKDHLSNGFNNEINGYDYISIVHKQKHAVGVKASADCSFDNYGAPLITFANSLWTDENGFLRYGDHYEVVAYENGCNVWYITEAPKGSPRPFKVENCIRLRFKIEEKSRVSLSVKACDKMLSIEVNEASFDIPAPYLAKDMYVGITACEGINRFYSAKIEE